MYFYLAKVGFEPTCVILELSGTIGLIRKIPTLKPINLGILNFTHLVISTQPRKAENFNLIA